MTRRRVKRLQRVCGWATVGLALAWCLFSQLLWQVETLRSEHQSPEVRLVVSAIAPPISENENKGTTPEEPQTAAQPVLPDAETPAPCQLRRSVSTDVEVLAAPEAAPFLEVPGRLTEMFEPTDCVPGRFGVRPARVAQYTMAASLPRPPPIRF